MERSVSHWGETTGWAKSFPRGGEVEQWLPLATHLRDAEQTMYFLIDHWLGNALDPLILAQFPPPSDHCHQPPPSYARTQFRKVAGFCAASHDIGKLTPVFQQKVPALAHLTERAGLRFPEIPKIHAHKAPHSLAGAALLLRYCDEENLPQLRALASIIGGHHGIPLTRDGLDDTCNRPQLLGADWWHAQKQAITEAIERTQVLTALSSDMSWHQPLLVQLEALTEVADWLASNADYFPLQNLPATALAQSNTPSPGQSERSREAFARFELPAPWQARDLHDDAKALLHSRFGLPDTCQPSPAQRQILDIAREIDSNGGLIILEDATGSGKTEAALMAAEVLAARTGRTGIAFALPTQATTNAMFTRVINWLGNISRAYESDQTYATALQHGAADLEDSLAALRQEGWKIHDALMSRLPLEEDPEQIVALPWLSGRRKSVLADFVVTTIDHVLFAGLKSRYVELRHLGLARKVLILDEVHSYSEYMVTFLESTLRWLASYGTPIIMLSATLSASARHRFTQAYQQGRRIHLAPSAPPRSSSLATQRGLSWAERRAQLSSRNKPSTPELPNGPELPASYPAITTATAKHIDVRQLPRSDRTSTIHLSRLPENQPLADYLENALQQGGCAVVVRNTVRRAQQTYRELRSRFGENLRLMHAGFTVADRQANDAWLLKHFGKAAGPDQRPQRFVVVATQVIEQSLDIDFDLLITDLAPMDLLLQRMGRLHRHPNRSRPTALSEPICVLDCLPSDPETEPEFERGAAFIYHPRTLAKTALTLLPYLSSNRPVTIPDSTVELMSAVYDQTGITLPPNWRTSMAPAIAERDSRINTALRGAQTFALAPPATPSPRTDLTDWYTFASAEERTTNHVARAAVRDGADSIAVILISYDGAATYRLLPHLGGEEISIHAAPPPVLAKRLARSAVRLPAQFNRGDVLDRAINELEKKYYFPAWQSSRILKGVLVLPLQSNRAQLAGYVLKYSPTEGIQIVDDEYR
ncbi:MAG: CRISPR-associated helicase Cas3' [Bowdeniella nasicola]|nr:CRISPR-associated helicase Cas3' [Bowdeniella nasicola]